MDFLNDILFLWMNEGTSFVVKIFMGLPLCKMQVANFIRHYTSEAEKDHLKIVLIL